jgi:hypothetical protein
MVPGTAFDDAAHTRAQVAGIDAVDGALADDARSWATQLIHTAALAKRSEAHPDPNDARFLPMELAGAWRISQLTANRWLTDAERFSEALPMTLDLLAQGRLYRHQAQVLLHRTRNCTVEIAQAVEAELLPDAAALCPSDLSKKIDRLVLRLSSQDDPEAVEDQHARAAADRRTFSYPEPDGMAIAGAFLTAEQQVGWSAAMDALERRERRADRAAGVERTADQRRADIFAALPAMVLAGTAQDEASRRTGQPLRPWTLGPEQLAATVVLNIFVPVSTVLDLSREPATLDRYGPVSAEHVRLVRPTMFRRVLVDADTGRPIAVDDHTTAVDADRLTEQVSAMLRPEVVTDIDEPQHDPSARLARLVDLRDVHCSGPGCSSSRTDRDHLDPWPAGPTNAANLGRLSTRCHAAKHNGWHLERHPDGSTTWTSRYGRNYTRLSPHPPPPQVDPYTEPPPRQPRPRPPQPWWAFTDEAARAAQIQQTVPRQPPPRPVADDDPPF